MTNLEGTMPKPAFFPHTTQYRYQNAVLMAKAAKLAYESPEVIHAKITTWGFSQFAFFDRKETQAFVTGNRDMILVAFRGTEPDKLKDWMTDIQFRRKPGPYGKVHRGFLRSLNYVWSDIHNALSSFQDRGQSLWFTGHSLGAALATLAVAKMGEDARPVNGLYTFGQPRVGGRTFARNFNGDFKSLSFRFVNSNDIVTRVPTRELGFRHVGQVFYIDSSGILHDDIHWWNQFVDRVKGHIDDLGKIGTAGLKDHSMAKYVRNLAKKENRTVGASS